MATIGSIYSNSATNIGGVFSKVKEYYFSMSVATITNALRNAGLPKGAKITKIEIEPHIEIENSVAGNFFFSYGFGSNNSSIGTTLINGAQITKVAISGSIKPKANITSYMSSLQAPYACSTAYGSYFNFKVHADTLGKRSYWLRSVYLYVTYEVWHTATFKNGETVLQTVSVKSGSTPSYTGTTPTKEQTTQSVYTFSGWNPAIGAITADTTYIAQFTESPRPYWVQGISRSEECEIRGSQYYNYGDTITLEAYNFAEHKEFHYWSNFLGDTFKSYSNPLVVTLNEELLERCPLETNGGICFECYTRGKLYTLKAEVLPDSAMGSVYFSTILIVDGEFWWGNNVEVIVPNEGVTYRYGETEYSLGFKAVPNKGYRFVRWSDGVTDNPRIIADGDYSYTAIFEEDTYTVKVSAIPPEGGTITGGGVYPSGELVDIDMNPNKGYKLTGYYKNSDWYDINGSYGLSYSFYIQKDTEITAVFALRTYTVTFKDYDGTIIPVNGQNNQIIEYGKLPTEPPTPIRPSTAQYSYEFDGWDPPIDKVNGIVGDTVYIAKFKENLRNYSISVKDGTVTLLSGSKVGDNYEYGSILEITANEKEGYKFLGWSGNSSSTEKTIRYTVTSEATFEALYKKLQMKFKGVKILHHSTSEVASPTNPLIGGEDQAIIEVKVAFE